MRAASVILAVATFIGSVHLLTYEDREDDIWVEVEKPEYELPPYKLNFTNMDANTFVQQYNVTSPDMIKQKLKDAVDKKAEEIKEKLKNGEAITPLGRKINKRENGYIDYAGTLSLYKQMSDFLNEHNVHIKF